MRNEKAKTMKFNINKEDERELWEWLQRLPFGEFSDETKKFWVERMKKAKEE